jgi:hypothetical protein
MAMGVTRRKFNAAFRGNAVRHEVVDLGGASCVNRWLGIPT